MSSISQYIDIYRDNSAVIDSRSAGVLNSLRPAALKALDGRKLPERGEEGYEKTSLEKMFAPDFGLNILRLNIPVDIAHTFKCDVPRVSTLMSYVINDKFVTGSATPDRLPEGVIFGSLAEEAVKHPELIGRYYGSMAPLDSVPVALNTLLVQDGVAHAAAIPEAQVGNDQNGETAPACEHIQFAYSAYGGASSADSA